VAIDPALRVQHPHLALAIRLLNAGGWLLVTSLFALCSPARLRTGVHLLPELGLRTAAVGAMAYLTLLAALVATVGLGPPLNVPLTAAVVILFLVLKTIGLAVLGGGLGGPLLDRLLRRPLPRTCGVFVGVGLLLLTRFLPVVGGALWTIASVVALGASVLVAAPAPPDAAELPAST
jgi:hypothetical protein